ncbi:hypothetical protein Q3H59_003467 [Pantoea sp. SORGH_AS 659]|nr:hypothetical protein [Pantoea sp. SORGH_AS_0659]
MCLLSPIPAFPRKRGKEIRCALPPIPAFPRERGKEMLPHAASERTYGSIFPPHLWGRTEEGESEHNFGRTEEGESEHNPKLFLHRIKKQQTHTNPLLHMIHVIPHRNLLRALQRHHER